MKLLFISIILFFVVSCKSTPIEPVTQNHEMIVADDGQLNDSLKNLFYDDACRLAIKYNIELDSTNIDSIKIPEKMIDNFYNGLVHIYNQQKMPERDSVFTTFNIHTWLSPELNVFNLYMDSTCQWIYKWIAGNYYTGYEKLDSLMDYYEINITKTKRNFTSSIRFEADLFTKQKYNINALASIFRKLDGVMFADPRGYAGGGNNIRAYIEENSINFTFGLGWGDCPSGCTKWHGWNFEVDFDGTVTFMWSKGSSTVDY